MLLLFSIAAIISTFLGGLFALRFKDKLHLILGFSAGAVIGIAFFDLLPEALELAESFGDSTVTMLVALGFVIYLILNNVLSLHAHGDEDCHNDRHKGTLGAGSYIIHSFFDGAAVGLAFQASTEVGLVVASAVLAHNFSDGINTVGFILRSEGSRSQALRWLLINAVAPTLGVISTMFFTVPSDILGLILAVFCGFFLYIGAGDLLPESHHKHSTGLTTAMTVLGIGVMYLIITFAGI